MIHGNLKEWNGIPIKEYNPAEPIDPATISRICYSWDDESLTAKEKFEKYLADPRCEESIGLSLGLPEDTAGEFYSQLVKPLLEQSKRFANLKFLFLGEMEGEQSELTWIGQGDCGAPVLNAFPGLEDLRARGGLDYVDGDGDGAMEFSSARHICLKKLVIETGGLPKEALGNLRECVFPELEHLEIWLGCDERGGNASLDEVKPFLHDNPFPKLKYLGFKNAELVNEIALEIANAPVLDQLETLDLSLGTLQDHGAAALVASEKVKGLRKLDLHHHFLGDEMMEKVEGLGIEVDLSGQESAEDYGDGEYYYVAVSE